MVGMTELFVLPSLSGKKKNDAKGEGSPHSCQMSAIAWEFSRDNSALLSLVMEWWPRRIIKEGVGENGMTTSLHSPRIIRHWFGWLIHYNDINQEDGLSILPRTVDLLSDLLSCEMCPGTYHACEAVAVDEHHFNQNREQMLIWIEFRWSEGQTYHQALAA